MIVNGNKRGGHEGDGVGGLAGAMVGGWLVVEPLMQATKHDREEG